MSYSNVHLEQSVVGTLHNDLEWEVSKRPDQSLTTVPINNHLALIDSHNNKAIRSGKYMCLSDGEEDSGLEVGYRGTSTGMLGLSSDDESSSEDEGYEKSQQQYEHYNPDKYDPVETVTEANSFNDSDNCKFGQPSQKHAITEILHDRIEIRPKIIDDFGGWDATFHVRSSRPSKSNIRKFPKTPRTTSAFPRPSTEQRENPYHFKHYDDITDYIKEYRNSQVMKDNRLKAASEGEECLLVPDPYATKLKNNMCSIAENCDFLTVYSSSTKEKVENRPKEKEPPKDRAPSLIYLRPRPSSLVHCPTYDSDEEGGAVDSKRPTSLKYFPATHSRPIRVTSMKNPELRNSDRTDKCVSVKDQGSHPVERKANVGSCTPKQRPSSVVYRVDHSDTAAKQLTRQPPRPYSDHPFVVRTLSVKDRSKLLNLAPVRNQEKNDLKKEYRKSVLPDNMSLDHYLNLVLPHRQMQRKDSSLTASSLSTTCEKDEGYNKKTALHKTNIQLNIDGPCDPWTPKFEMKRSSSRSSGSPYKKTNSAGLSRQRTIVTPDTAQSSKQWPCRPELTLSRANTYHTNIYTKKDSGDKELSINACSNRSSTPNVQRVYGQRFRCCERIHALLSSDNDDTLKKSKDRHIKLSVDNMKVEKPNPLSFGSFGIRKGMMREDNSVTLSCMYKLKRERQRRFNISLVK